MSKHTIEVNVPDGWVPVAYREPKVGEHFLMHGQPNKVTVNLMTDYLIVEPEWQWPEWLTAPWIAMDIKGSWYAYATEPVLGTGEFWSDDTTSWLASNLLAFTPPPCTNWRESKRRNPRLA